MVESEQILEDRAKILLAADRSAQAETILAGLLAKHPNNSLYQEQMMRVLAGEGKFDQLVTTVGGILAKNPDDLPATYFRGLARLRQNPQDIDGALHDFKTVLKADPSHVDARYWLAELYRQRNDWDSAIDQVEQALAIQPTNKRVRLKLIELNSTATPPRWNERP